jgi:hypothetical protein
MRDINTTNNYYGAYCFHDTLTVYSHGLGEDLNQEKKQFNWKKAKYYLIEQVLLGMGVGLIVVGCFTSPFIVGLPIVAAGVVSFCEGLILIEEDPYKDQDWWIG